MMNYKALSFICILFVLVATMASIPVRAASNNYNATMDKARIDRIGARVRFKTGGILKYLKASAQVDQGKVLLVGRYYGLKVRSGALVEFPEATAVIVCWNKDPSKTPQSNPSCRQSNSDGYYKFRTGSANDGCIGTIWADGGGSHPAISSDIVVVGATCD